MEEQNASARIIATFGEALFLTDEPTLLKYSSSFNGTDVKPLGIFLPQSESDVVSFIKYANVNALAVYPISRGKNFGYGQAQGTRAGQVIIDLKQMNKIIEVNETLAYARIEPGVAQTELSSYLINNNIKLQVDVTGAGLSASITGNILERGFGHTDYGDRFGRIIALTAVTGSGQIIRTGFSGFENANAKYVYRYGIGPVIDGLFSQSNYGIITEITIELMPVPEAMQMFVLSTSNEDNFSNLVDAVREMRLNGVVNSAVHIANKSRAVGEGNNKFVGAWNLSGSITGPSSVVYAKKKAVQTIFRKHVKGYKLHFLDHKRMNLLAFINKHIIRLPVFDPLTDIFDLLNGQPTDNPLRTLMNNSELSSDSFNASGHDTCFSWINAVCSGDGKNAGRLLELMKNQFSKHGYEFRVTFTFVTPRSLVMISNITYERSQESIENGLAFSKECTKLLIQNGFIPYRSGPGMYDRLPAWSDDYSNILAEIKKVFDPNNVIAPAKYNI